MHCGECGSRKFTKRTIKGYTFPYKDKELIFNEDYDCIRCDDCDNIIVSNKDINYIDKVLEKIYESKI